MQIMATVGGLRVAVEAPDELAPRLVELRGGTEVGASSEAPAVRYTVTTEREGRYGLERDGGGLCRDAGPDAVTQSLTRDLTHAVARRNPDQVVVDGGVVAVDGRGVLVLGAPRKETAELLAALAAAGAERCSEGLAVLDASGDAHPTTITTDDPDIRRAAPPPVPVSMIVATEYVPGVQWAPTEVTGARAVLGLLGHVLAPGASSPVVRALGRRLAPRVVELRGQRPDAAAVAADILDRVRLLEVPEPIEPEGPAEPRSDPEPLSPPVVRFEDFLDPDLHDRLLELAVSRAADFEASGVHAAALGEGDQHPEVRRSRSIYDLGPIWEEIQATIVELLPHVRRELGVAWFPLGDIEHHLTAHGDGDHFALHADNATPDTDRREVSAVYYFNRQPRRFTGGALRLFDTVERDGVAEPADTHTDIDPADNSVVFFRSDAYHEVRPVHLESDDFADQRFTLVFWARRVPPVQAVFQGDPDTVTARQHELVPSLTPDGFRIVPTPPEVQDRLLRLFDERRDTATAEPTDMTFLPTGDPALIPVEEAGPEVLAALQGLHEEWAGCRLEPSAAYGIRVYGEGQTLRPHCDRVETHVISSIVHVAADVDEPWALTVEDAVGRVHDVYLEPGEMLLYESAKLPHGRPRPLRGRHYASVFLHYRPTDWDRTLTEVCRRAGPYGVPAP